MHVSIKYLTAGAVWLLVVFACVYGASGVTGSTLLTVATPTPGGTPAPPTLSSPAIIQPNTTPLGICHINGDGVTDDFPCFKSIMSAGHDLDIKAGTYVLTAADGRYTVPASTKIYCENPSLPPPATAPVVLLVPDVPGPNWDVFYEWGGTSSDHGELYGCEVHGTHYPNVTWSNDDQGWLGHGEPSWTDDFIRAFTPSYLDIYNNGFDGWPGSTAVISTNYNNPPAGTWPPTQWPTNFNISWNRFANCNTRATEIDAGTNMQITNNTIVDCQLISEMQGYGLPSMPILYDSNTLTYVNGAQGGATSNTANFLGGGESCSNGSRGTLTPEPTCTITSPIGWDYSAITVRNNTLSCAGAAACKLYENNTTGASAPAVYRNNTCGTGCTQLNPPGSGYNNVANFNSWGNGSTQ